MELKDQATTPTLAQRLGDTAHVSGLAIRLARESGAGERLPEWLHKVAVGRGVKHHQRDFDAGLPPDNPGISDEEIGVAMRLGQMPDNPWLVRAAAQLLSSPKIDPARLALLAEMERVEPVVLHIAAAAERVDAGAESWATLREMLHPRRTARPDVLPQWLLPHFAKCGNNTVTSTLRHYAKASSASAWPSTCGCSVMAKRWLFLLRTT